MIEGSKKASPGLPGGSDCKEPLAMWETQVRSLAWEDPLEKGMATHSSIPWRKEPGRPQSMGSQKVGHD